MLREVYRRPQCIIVDPDLVQHLCAARDLFGVGLKKVYMRLCGFCSTSVCCERFGEGRKTQAFTPILFNIYVLRAIQRMPQNTSVYPDLVQRPCAASDLGKAPKHKRLLRSCSTSMCCERFREGLKMQAFTTILFNIYVLREIYREGLQA